MIPAVARFLRHWFADSLFRNAVFLIASTAATAGLGFFFWFVNARLFSPHDVGLASALISVIGLISSFSLLGTNIGLIRYLPPARTSEEKAAHLDTSFTVTALATIVVVVVFLAGLQWFSPALLFLRQGWLTMSFFGLSMVWMTWFVLIESVFTAERAASHILVKNVIFSVLKLALPWFLVVYASLGIFASWTIAGVLSLLYAFGVLFVRYGYRPRARIDMAVLRETTAYSLGNHLEGFIGGLPILVLPLMVTNVLGAETTAYYYIVMTIIGVIYFIPQAVARSLFAEGAHDESQLRAYVGKAIRIIALILIPVLLGTALLGHFILGLFGPTYASAGTQFLQIMSVTAILVSANSVFAILLRLSGSVKELVMISTGFAIIVLVASTLLIHHGLAGIGIAWLLGHGCMAGTYLILRSRRPELFFAH